jgi:hypothetical protein
MGTYGKLMELNQSTQTEKKETLEPISPGINLPAPQVRRETPKPKARYRDITIPRNHATTTPRYRDTTTEAIRAAVKVFGKEAATYRFTLEEKKALRDIVYAYEAQNIRTSENEITRIGVNFLIEDYRQNGDNSVLHKALSALNS